LFILLNTGVICWAGWNQCTE